MSELTEALLQRLYIEEKKSLREIGLLYGKPAPWVWRRCKKFNIPTRPFSTQGLKLNPEWREKVIKTLSLYKKGKDNPAWKGGKIINRWGYVKIKISKGYKFEHRAIIEKSIGRELSKLEQVHHLNGNKRDNRLENLVVLSPEEHTRLHNKNKIWQKYRK